MLYSNNVAVLEVRGLRSSQRPFTNVKPSIILTAAESFTRKRERNGPWQGCCSDYGCAYIANDYRPGRLEPSNWALTFLDRSALSETTLLSPKLTFVSELFERTGRSQVTAGSKEEILRGLVDCMPISPCPMEDSNCCGPFEVVTHKPPSQSFGWPGCSVQ